MRDARDWAMEAVGLIRQGFVNDLEVWAADIQDTEFDRLVDVFRYDVERLGNRLAQIRLERESLR